MQFQLLSALALAGSALAGFSNDTDVTVTEVVTALTTYCPEPTTFEQNGKTYTVTEATTLTITDCPCTVTHTSGKPKPKPSSAAPTHSTATPDFNAAGKVGVAGLAAAAGAAVYLL
ncbi:hypothetical protein CANINC_004059 [Pichia inconspicua]|uniref:Clock-controlled protein 6 n=1 Tax=Pichia inconspicua TaxID=52247 RepID=A0A4T0WXF7_9ASCO|nr:hypothetical protein CANINC_004059 [[Candida] inconspicua]